MSVNNGQPANETVFNAAFWSRTTDTDTVGKVDQKEASTTDLIDTQRVINEALDAAGIANQAATDPNAKVYSSTTVISDGDDKKVALGKLDAALESGFDPLTGHDHDGVNSKLIDAADLDNTNHLFGEFVENTFAASGLSDDVSANHGGDTPGGDASNVGVVTTAPLNYISIIDTADGSEVVDGSGRRVFARMTEAASVWTLTYYVNIAGVETAHSLTAATIKYLYREVFDQNDRPTLGANAGVYDSVNAVSDIPDASTTEAGKVTIAAQTFAGDKDFQDGLNVGGVDVVDLSSAQTLTNKIESGVSVESPIRLDVKKDTDANLVTYALSATNGQLCFATDTKLLYQVIDAALVGFVDDSTAQTISNKTMSNASIEGPSRLDVKQDTDANLITYAGSATNGQLCFATDTKTLYQVIDLALVEVGGGGGGGTNLVALLEDRKTINTGGGTFTSGSFVTRTLNTLSHDTGFISLLANQFTLDPGDYEIEWHCPGTAVNRHVSILYNITTAAMEKNGTAQYCDNGLLIQTTSEGFTKVSIGVNTTYELRHQCSATKATTGLGINDIYGAYEVHSWATVRKVA